MNTNTYECRQLCMRGAGQSPIWSAYLDNTFENKKYEELMAFKDKGVSVKVSTVGDNNEIDEFLVLASSKEMGFTIVRIIGDNMRPEQLIKLSQKLQNADIDQAQFKSLMTFFK